MVLIIAAKQLFLLRHAKSSHDDPDLADHDRRLAPRGRRAAAAMASHMQERELEPALVLCSSATRARQTLDPIAAALGRFTSSDSPSRSRIISLDLASGGPDLAKLARKYPPGALAVLRVEGSWGDLDADGARLTAFVKPRDLE